MIFLRYSSQNFASPLDSGLKLDVTSYKPTGWQPGRAEEGSLVHSSKIAFLADAWGAKYGYGPKQIISETGTLRSETFIFRNIVP